MIRFLIQRILLKDSMISKLPIAKCKSPKELSKYLISSYIDLKDNEMCPDAFYILIPLYCLQVVSIEELKIFFCINYYYHTNDFEIKHKSDWVFVINRQIKAGYVKSYHIKKGASFGNTYYYLTKKGYNYVNEFLEKTTQSEPEYSIIFRKYKDFVDVTSPIFSHNFLVGINYMCLVAAGLKNINWSTDFLVGNFKKFGRSKDTVSPDATCKLNDSFNNSYTMYFEQDMFTEDPSVLVGKIENYFHKSDYLDVVKIKNGIASTNVNTGIFISFGEKNNEVFNKNTMVNILKKHIVIKNTCRNKSPIENDFSNNICARVFFMLRDYYHKDNHRLRNLFEYIEDKENRSVLLEKIRDHLRKSEDILVISSLEEASKVIADCCINIYIFSRECRFSQFYSHTDAVLLLISCISSCSINLLGFEEYKDYLSKKSFRRKRSIIYNIQKRLSYGYDVDYVLLNLMTGCGCFLYSQLDFFQVIPYFFIKEFGLFDIYKDMSQKILGSSVVGYEDSISTARSDFSYKMGQTRYCPIIKNVFSYNTKSVCFEDIYNDVCAFFRMIVARLFLRKHPNFDRITIIMIVKDADYAKIFFDVLRSINRNIRSVYDESSYIRFLFINRFFLENNRINTYNLTYNGDNIDTENIQLAGYVSPYIFA